MRVLLQYIYIYMYKNNQLLDTSHSWIINNFHEKFHRYPLINLEIMGTDTGGRIDTIILSRQD